MASHSHSGPSGSQLHSAVRLGSVKKVRDILDQPDVDVNCLSSKHETPLHLACTLGHTVIVQLLITLVLMFSLKMLIMRMYLKKVAHGVVM